MQMNHFAGLPWRIAALAGLLVGAISLLTGADPWTSLLRVSAAFAVFAAAGFALSFLLHAGTPPAQDHHSAQGRHFDHSASDSQSPEDAPDSEL